MQIILQATRVTVSLLFLLYASWRDYQTREVSNRVWVFFAPIALVLSLVEFLLYSPWNLPYFAMSIGATTLLALLLFYVGGFGGADSKALICLALALPFYPILLFTPLLTGGLSPLSQYLFPLTILSNGILLAAATAVYLLFRNLVWHKKTGKKIFEGELAKESFGKKIVVLITGYKVSIAKLKEKWHIYPMEDIEANACETCPERKLVIVPKDEGRDSIVERLSAAVDSGKIGDSVWATPGLPMLIFLTVGLIVALVLGDLVWALVSLFFG